MHQILSLFITQLHAAERRWQAQHTHYFLKLLFEVHIVAFLPEKRSQWTANGSNSDIICLFILWFAFVLLRHIRTWSCAPIIILTHAKRANRRTLASRAHTHAMRIRVIIIYMQMSESSWVPTHNTLFIGVYILPCGRITDEFSSFPLFAGCMRALGAPPINVCVRRLLVNKRSRGREIYCADLILL